MGKLGKKFRPLGKLTPNIRKVRGETEKKRSSLDFGWEIRKIEPN